MKIIKIINIFKTKTKLRGMNRQCLSAVANLSQNRGKIKNALDGASRMKEEQGVYMWKA